MNFPANYVHAFVAIPIFLVFSIASMRSYAKTKNITSLYLGIVGVCYMLMLSLFVLPAVLTDNSRVLTASVLTGSFLELIAGITLWVIVARLYAPKSDFTRGIIIALSVVAAIFAAYLALRDLMRVPVTIVESGGLQIIFSPVSREYVRILSVQYVSSIFLSIIFWRQSLVVTTARDKMRLRVLSVVFAVTFIVLGLLPFSSSGSNGVLTVAQSLQIMVAILLLGVFMAITFFIKPDKKV